MLRFIPLRFGRPSATKQIRHLKNVGKKHITPPYEREGRPTRPEGGGSGRGPGRQASQGVVGVQNTHLWARAPLGDPLLRGAARHFQGPLGGGRGGAAAANGPGSFLKGLGRQVAESGAVGVVVLSPGGGGGGRGGGAAGGDADPGGGRREDAGPRRRKELYAEN